MGFNKENYARIKEEYSGKYLRAQDAARLRRLEIDGKLPEVAEIDAALAASGLRIFEATLTNNLEMLSEIEKENAALIEKRGKILISAGYPADYTEVKYECDECGDTGVVDFRICRCMKEKLIMAGLESSGMRSLIESQTFDNFDLRYYSGEALTRIKMIVEITKNYADNFEAGKSGSIIMMGNTGLGKTHLSSAMGGVIIGKGNDVYYTGAVDMLSDFEADRFSYDRSGESSAALEKYFTSDLLIIDDLGTELINQFSTSCLYNIINTRLIKKKATIINTNFTRDELRKKYQDRITSRIFGEYTVLPFLGTDIREQKILRR